MTAKLMLLIRVISRKVAEGEPLELALAGYPGLGFREKQAVMEYFGQK